MFNVCPRFSVFVLKIDEELVLKYSNSDSFKSIHAESVVLSAYWKDSIIWKNTNVIISANSNACVRRYILQG
jgi:hypothetical protein